MYHIQNLYLLNSLKYFTNVCLFKIIIIIVFSFNIEAKVPRDPLFTKVNTALSGCTQTAKLHAFVIPNKSLTITAQKILLQHININNHKTQYARVIWSASVVEVPTPNIIKPTVSLIWMTATVYCYKAITPRCPLIYRPLFLCIACRIGLAHHI